MEENEKKYNQSKINKELSIIKIKDNLNQKEKITQERINDLMEKKHKKIEDKKEMYQKKIENIKNSLKKSRENIRLRNKRIMQHQEKINNIVHQMEINKNIKILERAKSQNELYLKSIVKRDINFQKMLERFDLIKQKSKKIDKKISKDKIHNMYNYTLKKEDEFIKQYEKQHTMVRFNRISNYRNQIRAEELSEKEKKKELYKYKKLKLKNNKFRMTDYIQKEKQQIIDKFDNVLQKNKQINAEVVKKLFPNDEELYKKIKNLEEKMTKRSNNNKNNNNNNSSNAKADELVFVTQKNKNEDNTKEIEKINKIINENN